LNGRMILEELDKGEGEEKENEGKPLN
jgi:hypothetical protein